MKDTKTNPDVYTPSENWQGFAVPFIATAYVMANSLEDAKWKVEAAMRKQQRVMLTKLDMLQPVAATEPDAIENLPDTRQATVKPEPVTATVAKVLEARMAEPDVPVPYIVCSAHKRDIHKKCDCAPGESCNAGYWSAKLKGGK